MTRKKCKMLYIRQPSLYMYVKRFLQRVGGWHFTECSICRDFFLHGSLDPSKVCGMRNIVRGRTSSVHNFTLCYVLLFLEPSVALLPEEGGVMLEGHAP